jgi:hypothetical protein
MAAALCTTVLATQHVIQCVQTQTVVPICCYVPLPPLLLLLQAYARRAPEDARQLHLRSCVVKAAATWSRWQVLQQCRECCGGQGFLAANRIGAGQGWLSGMSACEVVGQSGLCWRVCPLCLVPPWGACWTGGVLGLRRLDV